MIIDKLENLPMYFSLHPDMEKACEFLKEFYANPGELRRYDLNDAGLFVNAETYTTKYAEGRHAEAHRKYVDLQFVVSGREQIGLAPIEKTTPVDEFSEEKDIGFYDCEYTQWAVLEPGWFCLIWPHEAHLPCTVLDEPCTVVKTVAKLPL